MTEITSTVNTVSDKLKEFKKNIRIFLGAIYKTSSECQSEEERQIHKEALESLTQIFSV